MTTYRKTFNISVNDQKTLLQILGLDGPDAHFIRSIELAHPVMPPENANESSVSVSMTDVDFISFSSWLERSMATPAFNDSANFHENACLERVMKSFKAAPYELNSWNNF